MKNPDFSPAESYALFGVRRGGGGFGRAVADKLAAGGYAFHIVHPEAERIGPWTPVRHVRELPAPPDAAILCSPAGQSRAILEQLHAAGTRRVYAAPGATDDAGRSYAREQGMYLYGECPLLHVPGIGFPHNFHRLLVELFGR